MNPEEHPARRRRIRWLIAGIALVVVAWSAVSLLAAARAGADAKDELLAARTALEARQVGPTRTHLAAAGVDLDKVERGLRRLGPIRPVARMVPLVRVQLRGIEAYAAAARDMKAGAERLVDAYETVIEPGPSASSIAQSAAALRKVKAALDDGNRSLDDALRVLSPLDGKRLFGPLDAARRELATQLPKVRTQARDAQQGVAALLGFVGANGPRRYLVLAQNPDEVRPTGGFIGSYGVLEADGGVHLDRFEGIEEWDTAHPDVAVRAEDVAPPFRVLATPTPQLLANVNATIDLARVAPVALDLWHQGGEATPDGILLITPDLLARVLSVLGPVSVPEFGETVSAANLLARLDFYTHEQAASDRPVGGRKEFLSVTAEAVMHRLLDAPADRWLDLGRQVGAAFDAREAMAWSSDRPVARALRARGWDGHLPNEPGDFFAWSEFEYAAKNGRGLRRTFRHTVRLAPDGSGTVATAVTIANTRPFEPKGKLNIEALVYAVAYGPVGAQRAPGSPRRYAPEEPVAGHPPSSSLLRAAPLGTAATSVTWQAPGLLTQEADGLWHYRLHWWHVATSSGDRLELDVHLPPGWRWRGAGPPASVTLGEDFRGDWVAETP